MAEDNAAKTIQETLDVINLINSALPGILRIINMIRDADPGMTIGEFRKQADAIYDSNLAEIEKWRKDHPEVFPT